MLTPPNVRLPRLAMFLLLQLAMTITFSAREVSSTVGLHCYNCSSKTTGQKCFHLDFGPARSPVISCLAGELCSKEIATLTKVFPNGTTITEEKIRRSCILFNSKVYRINECIHEVAPPFSSSRCLCNDSNFCNGGHFFQPCYLTFSMSFLLALLAAAAERKKNI